MRVCWKTLLGITLLSAGVVLCVWGATLLLKTDQYVATARVLTPSDLSLLNEFTDPTQQSLYYSYEWEHLFSLFRSPAILSNVVTRLDLNGIYGKRRSGGRAATTQESINIINESMEPVPVRGTRLMEIRVRSGHPGEAAAVANAVAEAYQDDRIITCREPAENRLQTMQAKYEEDAKLIPLLSSNVHLLRLECHIKEGDVDPLMVPVPLPASQLWLGSPSGQMESVLHAQRAYQRETYDYTNIQSLSREKRRNYVYAYYSGYQPEEWEPRGKLLDRLHSAEKEYAALTNRYAAKSLEIQQLSRLMDKLRGQIDTDADGIMSNKQHHIQLMKTGLDSLLANVRAGQTGEDKLPYWEKRHELEEQVNLQKSRAEKIEAAHQMLQNPRMLLVKIYPAEPPKVPAGPNRPLGTGLLFIGVFLNACGVWLARRKPT
jgi:capsular polysaccharide biosynthesis protein